MRLNPEQQRAVEVTDRPVMVLAGPGTGKTAMMVQKFLHLVEQGLDPRSILITTFTRKASEELSQRIGDALADAGHHSKVDVQNFHSLCARIINEFGPATGRMDGVRILDGVDLARFIDNNADAFHWEHTPFVRRRDYEVDHLIRFTNNALDRGLTTEDVLRMAKERRADGVSEERTGEYLDHARNHATLLGLLEEHGFLTYGTLMQTAIHILETDRDALDQVRARTQYVLVDEVQDNNAQQARLVELIVGDRGCVTVVGDEDQGIYKFRGAQTDILHRFQQRFDPEVVVLGRNYRSSRIIVAAARRLIEHNPDRFEGKTLTAEGPDADADAPVRCLTLLDDDQQAIGIAERLRAWKDADPARSWSDAAVLFRSLKKKGRLLEELQARGIPYEVSALSELLAVREVRDLVAWLRSLWNPNVDNPAVERVLRSTEVGIPWSDLGTVQRAHDWRVRRAAVEGQRAPNLVTMLRDAQDLDVADGTKQALRAAAALFTDLSAATRGMTALETAQHLLRRLDFAGRFPLDSPEGVQSWRNLADFLRVIKDHEATHPQDGLRGFVEFLQYAQRRGERFAEGPPDPLEDSVKVLTHHGAKGLEFSLVIIPNAHVGSIPAKKQWDWLEEFNAPPGDKQAMDREHEAEERRTFFVAMTRAERELLITRPRSVGGKETRWSPFVEEAAADAPEEVRFEDVDQRLEPSEAVGDPTTRRVRERLHALLQTPPDGVDAADRLRDLVGAVAAHWSHAEVQGLAEEIGAVVPEVEPTEPEPVGTLWLSATALLDYHQCPKKFQYRHDLAVPGRPSPTAVAGSNVHRALEVFHQEHKQDWRQQTTDRLLEIHDQVFASGRYRSPQEAEQYRAWERNILTRYLDDEKQQEGEPTHFEVHFEFTDEEMDATFHGYIDRIDEHDDGTVEVIDYKTGNPKNLNRYQMPLYVMGVEAKGMQVRAATHYLMRDAGDGKGPIERKRLPRQATGKRGALSDETIAAIRADIQDMVTGIRQRDFPAKPEERKCNFCDYRLLCPAWEQDA